MKGDKARASTLWRKLCCCTLCPQMHVDVPNKSLLTEELCAIYLCMFCAHHAYSARSATSGATAVSWANMQMEFTKVIVGRCSLRKSRPMGGEGLRPTASRNVWFRCPFRGD